MDEDSISPSDRVHLRLDGFEGPLDLLLDLARRQRVDLTRISILTLVDQFVATVTERPGADIARRTEWLVMAAWLTWLKSRLLLPHDLEEARQGELAGRILTDRLAELDIVKSVAAWLDARPQLGRDMFGRGDDHVPVGSVVVADLASLFQAYIDWLRRPARRAEEVYRPVRPALWTLIQARTRLLTMLDKLPDGGDLLVFLPPIPADAAKRSLRIRGAIASTLAAGLELARKGRVELRQAEPFGGIMVAAGTKTEFGEQLAG